MKMTLLDLSDKLRTAIGDGTVDISDDFMIGAYNWAVNDLALVPRLEKLFAKHKHFNLDADGHTKWSLSDALGFRRITKTPLRKFYTSTGGEPCELCLCYLPTEKFYEKNGLVDLKQKGKPCEYTIEVENDNVWIVLDRPSEVPIILDCIAYGIPKPVSSMDDEIEISGVAENLILEVMKTYYLHEADDYAFAADVISYLDNKKILEAIQILHRTWGGDETRVLGEV